MFKYYFAILLSCITCIAFSQSIILADPFTNRPLNTDKYSAIRGTPFLNENWQQGFATSARGTYKSLELKLDAYENRLYFNNNDVPYEFQDDILSFTMIVAGDTLHFRKGITGSNLKANQYVQVLSEGKINFYRSDIKSISEMSEINAGMVKSFITSTRYYISKDGKTELVKLNKDILDHLKDKEDQLKEFIEINKLSAKKEADMQKIVNYYNSL